MQKREWIFHFDDKIDSTNRSLYKLVTHRPMHTKMMAILYSATI